jgi:ATP-dependent phosphofructokinase / diphosphate-dependent phosphofructokinase
VLENNMFDLTRQPRDVIEGLCHTPGAGLGSSRYKLKKEEDFARLVEAFRKHDIRNFFYIGGNDSMDTADKINTIARKNNYDMKVIGIPKTIDNDLPHTDHAPGYGSAAKFLATTVLETGLDLKGLITNNRIVILEAMGRNSGWLAASAALAKRLDYDAPHLICLPEVPFSTAKFIEDVTAVYRENRFVYIVASEGIRSDNGEYVCADDCRDAFGHRQLGGLAETLKRLVEAEIGVTVRTNVLGTMQRVAMHFASLTDAQEACMAGAEAVRLAAKDVTGKMVTLVREGEGDDYRCGTGAVDLAMVANVEKKVPREWISQSGSYVNEKFIRYARPLIMGEVTFPTKDGLPGYVNLAGFNIPALRRKLDGYAAGVAR